MTDTYSEVTYARPKGPKVIQRVPQSGMGARFDGSRSLFRDFDYLCAVDTNTRIIGGEPISVVAIVQFVDAPPPVGSSQYWKLDVPFCLEFVGLRVEKPENFGWLAALSRLLQAGLVAPTTRVGVVVDSDLGKLNDYNSGSAAFFEDRLLPGTVKLIYASADTGGESLLNRVLKVADSVSSQVLDAVAAGRSPPNRKNNPTKYYDGMRVVYRDV
jgi:hypothetical protein